MEKLKEATEFIFSSYKRTATILFIAALTLAIPITINFLSQNQDVRQQASQVCQSVAADIMLVIDKSLSMDQGPVNNKPLAKAKEAANQFIDNVATNTQNKVGLVSYSSNNSTQLNSSLTSNFSSVKSAVNSINANGETCTQCGIRRANEEITANKRAGFKNAVILLTDGRANARLGSNSNNENEAEQAALNEAKTGNISNNTVYFTIGLGNQVNEKFLQEIANETGGQYFAAPTTDQLQSIYNQISQIVGKGSISGFVYNDTNGNGIQDDGEQNLSGWELILEDAQQQFAAVTAITDASGGFSLTGVCDGEYTLSITNQSGWTVTSPSNGNYDVIIINGESQSDKSFGVTQGGQPTEVPTATPTAILTATPTSTPTVTSINLSLKLVGIGAESSDSARLGINSNPENPIRNVELQVFNSQNQNVSSNAGQVAFNPITGNYEGAVSLGDNFASGSYLVRARLNNTLWKTLPGIQFITAGTQNQTPTTELVSGDTDQNNEINIIDYNAFISCLQLNKCGEDNEDSAGIFQNVITFIKKLVIGQASAQRRPGGSMPRLTPTPSSGCKPKPNNCDSWWSSFLSSCREPRQGWCQISPTPGISPTGVITPSISPSVSPTTQVTITTTPTIFPGTITPTGNPLPTVVTPVPTANPNVNSPTKARFDFDDNGIIDLPDLNILLNSFEERIGD